MKAARRVSADGSDDSLKGKLQKGGCVVSRGQQLGRCFRVHLEERPAASPLRQLLSQPSN